MTFLHIFFLGVLCTLIGVLFAYLYGRKHRGYSWTKYGLFMAGPIISVLLWSQLYDSKVLYLFVVGSFVGLILEFLLGLIYQLVFQRKLWEYDNKAFALLGHTSVLTIPMWGNAAVVFWITSQFVGL